MKQWKIYAMLVFVMFVWGANLPILKYLITIVPPVTLTAFRIFSASLVVFIILWKMKLLRKPTKQEWKYILLGSLTNVVLHHYFLNIGLIHHKWNPRGTHFRDRTNANSHFRSYYIKILSNENSMAWISIRTSRIQRLYFSWRKHIRWSKYWRLLCIPRYFSASS